MQILVDSYDTIAVLLWLQDKFLFIAASYEPRDNCSTAAREAALVKQLSGLSEAVQTTKSEAVGKQVDVLLCTDFNRHYVL
jgi:hypothetical protein